MSRSSSRPENLEADEETQKQREALGRLADLVSERRLSMPAIFMLEAGRPLSFVASQAMIFFEPILEAFCSPGDYRLVAEGLESRDNIEWLIQRLEAAEEARSRSNRQPEAADDKIED